MQQLLTPKQVAEILQVHPESVLRSLRKGILIGHKIGGVWRVTQDDLEMFIVKNNGNE